MSTKMTTTNSQQDARATTNKRQSANQLTPSPIELQNHKQSSSVKMTPATCRLFSVHRLAQCGSPLAVLTLVIMLLAALVSSIEAGYFGKRTQYHEQGLHGPKSYKFGFTSGDHKNPQERHEVSDGHGHVKGWYSFTDPHGKHHVVHYEAHPKHGFKVYNKHSQKAYDTGKRQWNS